ncbi:MAG: hypothetical protein ACPLX8_00325, partial [Nanopusillaceae archaeon]
SMQSAMQNIRDVNVRRQLQSQMALIERILARAVAEELKMSIKDLDELTPEERRRITDRITQLAGWYKGLIDTVKGSIANRFVLKYGDNPEFVSSITSLVEAYFDVPSTVLMELTNAVVGEKIADYRIVGDIMGYVFMKDSDLMSGLYKKSRELLETEIIKKYIEKQKQISNPNNPKKDKDSTGGGGSGGYGTLPMPRMLK